MKVLVYPHDLNIGGSQLNAIDIAAAVHQLGHETVIFGMPGALIPYIKDRGLAFLEAPNPGHRPSPRVVRALRDVIRERQIDVVHAYELPPALEALWATRGLAHTTLVTTVMSMAVAPFIPKHVPLLVGTKEIAAAEREFGRDIVGLLEPPVDLLRNGPSIEVGVQAFRRKWGLEDQKYNVVVVSRLAHELKLEGLLGAIAAIEQLAAALPVRLLICGDGPAGGRIRCLAKEVNLRVGPGTIVVTGELDDPRAAYATADVTLGMGGSALRAMAFGKPLVVQGEGGFWKLLTPDTLDQFLWTGWFGVGSDPEQGPARLVKILQSLLPDVDRRRELGDFSARTVHERFSVDTAARKQLAFYERAAGRRVNWRSDHVHATVAAVRFMRYHADRRLQQLRGSVASDDFNSRRVIRKPQMVEMQQRMER
ncbi:MAG: glycosyltransferase [Actinomycetota bacterium]|nr:glycosyltransferase [Actinomycetota bacterium]